MKSKRSETEKKKSKGDIRYNFRTAIFERDHYRCVVCKKQWGPGDVDPNLGHMNAHHIMDRHYFPNGGYVLENGVTVCDGKGNSCHMQCELFHISKGLKWNKNLHPDDLYQLIFSNFQLAKEADLRNVQ